MLKSQEETVANIKQVANSAERRLAEFAAFLKEFHSGEAWSAGNIPNFNYSLSQAVLESLRVLRAIRGWPINRIGLASEAACNSLLATLSNVNTTAQSMIEVKSRLLAETRPLAFLSFIFKSKVKGIIPLTHVSQLGITVSLEKTDAQVHRSRVLQTLS